MNDIIKKVDKIDEEIEEMSGLQKDRLNKLNLIGDDIIIFVKAQMDKVDNENSLKAIAVQEIANQINEDREKEPEDRNIHISSLIKIVEVMSKNENDVTLGIFDILKGQQKIKIETTPTENSNFKGESFTKEDMQDIKNMLNMLKGIKNTEFPKND